MRAALFVLIAGLLPALSHAATQGEEDQITVNRLNSNDFEVFSGRVAASNEYFWCGAATYIIRRQRGADLTPIYIKRPIGPSSTASGRKSVIFSTSSAGLPAAQERRTLTLEVPGAMLKAVFARSYCRDAFTRSTK